MCDEMNSSTSLIYCNLKKWKQYGMASYKNWRADYKNQKSEHAVADFSEITELPIQNIVVQGQNGSGKEET